MGWCTLRFRSVDQISTARTIAGVMMYSLKKPNSEFANSQEILFLEKWPVGVGKREYRKVGVSPLHPTFASKATTAPRNGRTAVAPLACGGSSANTSIRARRAACLPRHLRLVFAGRTFAVPVRIARSSLLLLNLGWLDGNALAATG
jgi:hypothetical protein